MLPFPIEEQSLNNTILRHPLANVLHQRPFHHLPLNIHTLQHPPEHSDDTPLLHLLRRALTCSTRWRRLLPFPTHNARHATRRANEAASFRVGPLFALLGLVTENGRYAVACGAEALAFFPAVLLEEAFGETFLAWAGGAGFGIVFFFFFFWLWGGGLGLRIGEGEGFWGWRVRRGWLLVEDWGGGEGGAGCEGWCLGGLSRWLVV